ncbi:MAG TPA: hypothetical protein VKA84_16505 [Gemmatimonadaceae bacterium]|nr:hypothetical protein [Gemmatimonadaceae bacterium]
MAGAFSVNGGSFYSSYRVSSSAPDGTTGWRLTVFGTGNIAPGPAPISVTAYCAAIP